MSKSDKWLHVENTVFIVCVFLFVMFVCSADYVKDWIKLYKAPCVQTDR